MSKLCGFKIDTRAQTCENGENVDADYDIVEIFLIINIKMNVITSRVFYAVVF